MNNQKENLQNFATNLGLVVNEYTPEDKRRNTLFYFTKNGTCCSPKMNYDKANHFLLGWHNSKNHV